MVGTGRERPGDRAPTAGVRFHDQSAGRRRSADARAGAGRVPRRHSPTPTSPTPTTPTRHRRDDTDLADTDVAGPGVADRELPEPVAAEPAVVEPGDGLGGAVAGSSRLGAAGVDSRYAGAMLLHAFYDRVGAAAVFAPLTGAGPAPARSRRFDDVALLTATSVAFALGVGSVEATKHLIRDQIGPLAGLVRLPELRTLRPRLAELAEACDPLGLQADLARAMLNAEAPLLGLYFVDDHFVPYEGAKPVGKGYNTKRRHAQKGLADTLVTDYHGRAVCFVSGPPSGLTKTLPAALSRAAPGHRRMRRSCSGSTGAGRTRRCSRTAAITGVDWITYRRGEARRHHRHRAAPVLAGRRRRAAPRR